MLTQPAFASIFGLCVGAGVISILLILSRFASKNNPYQHLIFGYLGFIASTVVGVVLLFVYYRLMRETFVWFGVSLVGGFFAGLIVYAVQNIRSMSDGKK